MFDKYLNEDDMIERFAQFHKGEKVMNIKDKQLDDDILRSKTVLTVEEVEFSLNSSPEFIMSILESEINDYELKNAYDVFIYGLTTDTGKEIVLKEYEIISANATEKDINNAHLLYKQYNKNVIFGTILFVLGFIMLFFSLFGGIFGKLDAKIYISNNYIAVAIITVAVIFSFFGYTMVLKSKPKFKKRK